VNVDGIRITSTLNLILMPLNLRFEYQDGIVAITCRDRQKAGLTNRVYPVADLMRPGIRSLQQDPEAQGIDQPVPAQALIDLITCTLDPAGWSEFGGQGRITYEEPTLSLVVIQTPRIHQEIADLLEQLRQLRDVEIELELSSVKISRDDFARIKSEWGADWYGNRVDAAPEQIERLTSLLAGVETIPIAGPARITLYEGQTWRVLATRAGDSPYAYVRAIPSPDRRRVDCRIAVPRITDGKQMLQDVSAARD
jgi:hypothetical protein